jgi:membrane fusion protein, heavy metal efflux system
MRLSLALGLALIVAACGEKAVKAPPPATVANPVAETRLTTVTLSPSAVRRLGIVTVAVESALVAPTRTVGGEVVVPPGLALSVAAPVAGTVLAPAGGPMPRAGSAVRKGQPILRLLALPADPARATEDLATVEARYRQAQLEAQRVEQLARDGLVSARDRERAEADLATATAALDAGRGRQALVRGGPPSDSSGLTPLVIEAPGSGVLAVLNAGPGQTVASGAVLAQVTALDRLWVRVPVFAGDVAALRQAASLSVSSLASQPAAWGSLPATPVTAPPSANPAAATVDLYYEVRGAAGKLQPGERVAVTIELGGGTRALVVPSTSVVYDVSGGSWVYERTDSVTFLRRRVEVARVLDGRAVLAHGPRAGVQVVTEGAVELFGTEFGPGTGEGSES